MYGKMSRAVQLIAGRGITNCKESGLVAICPYKSRRLIAIHCHTHRLGFLQHNLITSSAPRLFLRIICSSKHFSNCGLSLHDLRESPELSAKIVIIQFWCRTKATCYVKWVWFEGQILAAEILMQISVVAPFCEVKVHNSTTMYFEKHMIC